MSTAGASTVGFVGLGVMGSQIAKRLIDAGYRVHGYNRTPDKAVWLEDLGMVRAASPRAAAEAGDVVFTMVSDSEALRSVTEGANGILAGLRAKKVYVDLSTVDPDLSRELAKHVSGRGASMLDAPVSGSVSAVQSGQLSFMVGGNEAVFERVKPILVDIGSRATRVGANGQGCLMKVATNLQVAVQTIAFCESLLLAEGGGIERSVATEVLLQSVVASPMLRYRAPFILQLPKEAWFTVQLMNKDLRLATEAARTLGIRVPTTDAAEAVYREAIQRGFGDAEMAAVIAVLPGSAASAELEQPR
jgi:3-hydroxyisobutyrate dehydrogenase-like beta-hydroxyacid dehydrogenase